jgi:hypothetical protein
MGLLPGIGVIFGLWVAGSLAAGALWTVACYLGPRIARRYGSTGRSS